MAWITEQKNKIKDFFNGISDGFEPIHVIDISYKALILCMDQEDFYVSMKRKDVSTIPGIPQVDVGTNDPF